MMSNRFVVFTLVQVVFCELSPNLITEFCKTKYVSKATIFGCKSKKEQLALLKYTSKQGLRVRLINLNNLPLNYEDALHRKYDHLAVLVNADCENVGFLINESTDKKYFYETYHWLVVMGGSRNGSLLERAKLNINSDVHMAVDGGGDNFSIYDVYNPASEHGGALKINYLGYYNDDEGYQARVEGNRYWLRRNMSGVAFKSAVVIPKLDVPLKEYLEDDSNRQINSMHRFQTVCVNYCKDIFNFSLKVRRTDSWGYLQDNGRFDGLVSLLERRVVDFGSSPLLFKLDRMPFVDYSYGNWILRSTFIYRRPKVTANSYEIFLRPLERTVWLIIAVMMGLIMIVLKVIFWNEQTVQQRNHARVDSSWSFLILFTLGAFCQQGATCCPKLFSSRIVSIFVFLFCILIYQFYSASIVSYLLMDPPRIIFNLKDLQSSPLRVGIEDILIDRNYFVQTTDPDAIALFESKIKGDTNTSGFYSPIDGLALVKRGGFAFHVETSTAYPIIEETFTNQQICELEEVQMYKTQPMYTNLQKDSPFREMMNFCMYKLMENGNLDRLRKHWDARRPTCIHTAKKTEIHVTLKEFSCGLQALCFGICVSLLFLFIENVIHHRAALLQLVLMKKVNCRNTYPYLD